MTVADILCLPGWTVRKVENTETHLLIEAEVLGVPSACPLCGGVTPPYHFGYRPRCIADLPIRMQPVQIRARRRRYRCKDCSGTFLDALPGIHHQHDATVRLVEYIQSHALSLTGTFTSLANAMGVSEFFIRDVFAAHIERLGREGAAYAEAGSSRCVSSCFTDWDCSRKSFTSWTCSLKINMVLCRKRWKASSFPIPLY